MLLQLVSDDVLALGEGRPKAEIRLCAATVTVSACRRALGSHCGLVLCLLQWLSCLLFNKKSFLNGDLFAFYFLFFYFCCYFVNLLRVVIFALFFKNNWVAMTQGLKWTPSAETASHRALSMVLRASFNVLLPFLPSTKCL